MHLLQRHCTHMVGQQSVQFIVSYACIYNFYCCKLCPLWVSSKGLFVHYYQINLPSDCVAECKSSHANVISVLFPVIHLHTQRRSLSLFYAHAVTKFDFIILSVLFCVNKISYSKHLMFFKSCSIVFKSWPRA